MTHLLIWLLTFPLVAVFSTGWYAHHTDADVGRLSAGYTGVYITGTIILLTMHYV